MGLQGAGIIVDNGSTLLCMGDVTSGTALLGIIGIVITSVLLIKKVKGAFLCGILITALIGIPMRITRIDGVFSAPPSIEPIFFQFEWDKIFTKDMLIAVFTFLFMDLFDTIGTLVGVTTKAGMVDKNGKIPHLKQAFMVDALGTTVGAMLGTSTVTTFVESASGVGEGGRSGLTAFVTAICFLLSLFLAPFFLAIPGAATSSVLILVGLMMMGSVLKIDLSDYSEAIPAFLCMLFMPFAYSISDGIVWGVISYVLIHLLTGQRRKITVGMYLLAAAFVLKFFM